MGLKGRIAGRRPINRKRSHGGSGGALYPAGVGGALYPA